VDVKETKELLTFVAQLGNGIGLSLADGKWSLGDVGNFVPALQGIFPGLSGLNLVNDELADLTPEEVEEIKAHVTMVFEIPQDQVEEFVERGVQIGLDLANLVKDFFTKPSAVPA